MSSRHATLAELARVVPALASALGPNAEVVLHDLSKVPSSIVAVGGDLTGRTVGGPMTDLVLQRVRAGNFENYLRYRVIHAGRTFQSSTIFIRDAAGRPYGCLCINTDLTAYAALSHTLAMVMREGAEPDELSGGREALAAADLAGVMHNSSGDHSDAVADEVFAKSKEELVQAVVERAVAELGVPVPYMKKRQKMEVVRRADQKGLFMVRAFVQPMAEALKVSRYTIYDYLREVRGDGGGSGSGES
ncbi:MAG: helix-turn-helix transcriptional regulator [Candidatus Dormibacteraeota bacterium]|nr:helix-turn-helix transcriptional regulator [Candidatus Dormibacteraeota bacterium]